MWLRNMTINLQIKNKARNILCTSAIVHLFRITLFRDKKCDQFLGKENFVSGCDRPCSDISPVKEGTVYYHISHPYADTGCP